MSPPFKEKPNLGNLTNLYTEKEAAAWTGFSVAYFQRARWEGKGPRYIKLGRNVRYREDDLLAWISE
ncbi:MAG: helix-turn-helix domain-containing protein [Gammaproteobacteria bacterium]|nr:helix-turn-helix domain-containing protein [Gammaproteobacteria bacterium]